MIIIIIIIIIVSVISSCITVLMDTVCALAKRTMYNIA